MLDEISRMARETGPETGRGAFSGRVMEAMARVARHRLVPDGEQGKAGCDPGEVPALAAAIAAQSRLRLRGLMAIPEPLPGLEDRRAAFAAMARLQAELQARHAGVDTLSMGMSADYAQAIAEGSTMVRIGTALFGRRGG